MLRTLSKPAVKLMERYLPDPFIFVVILTLIAAAAAMIFEGATPVAVVRGGVTASGPCWPFRCRCCWFW